MIQAVAKRYAGALFQIASEGHKTDEVHRDCLNIQNLVKDSSEFAEFLQDPTIPSKICKKILCAIFKDEIHPTTKQFLQFLVRQKRLAILGAVCRAFDILYCHEKNIRDVGITVHEPLTAYQLGRVEKHLHDRLGGKIRSNVKVEKDLLGGVKIKIDDCVHDFSIKTQLEQFKQRILTAH